MNKKNKVDIFIANPRKAVWTLAVPIMFGMAIQTIYSIVDMIFVGRLGGDAIAALTFNMPLIFFSIGITFGIGTGATSVIAQFLGAKNKEEADNTAEHTVAMGLVIAILISSAGYIFRYHIFGFLGTPEHIIHIATDYFSIIVTGFVFTILSVFFRSIMTGEGDTRTPIYFQVFGTVLNTILDPIFIFKLNLGVRGAAEATVLSQAVVALCFAYYLFIKKGSYIDFKYRDFHFSWDIISKILVIGIPTSFSMIIMSMGGMIFNAILVHFGADAVAAYGVGGRMDQIFFLPIMALSGSMVTLGGMFFGAKRIDLIRNTLYYTLKRGMIIAFSFGIFFYIFAPQILRIFTSEEAILSMAIQYVRYIVFIFPFVTVGMISARTFQGFGEGVPGLILTSLRVVLLSAPLAYVFTQFLHKGIQWVWIAMIISSVIISVISFTWIRQRMTFHEQQLSQNLNTSEG